MPFCMVFWVFVIVSWKQWLVPSVLEEAGISIRYHIFYLNVVDMAYVPLMPWRIMACYDQFLVFF